MSNPVLIIGAGVAGMTAAVEKQWEVMLWTFTRHSLPMIASTVSREIAGVLESENASIGVHSLISLT